MPDRPPGDSATDGYDRPADDENKTRTDLTASLVDDLADEYERQEPFDLVEREHTETLPRAFVRGDFGRRDAEWVVQWYYRRGTVPDAERRDAEERFLDNDYEAMADAVQTAATATDLRTAVDRLTDLNGVDVAVASAFLAYSQPDRYVAVGPREWRALYEAGELDGPYPDSLTPAAYETYLDAVSAVCERIDREPWTVYRALWRLGVE